MSTQDGALLYRADESEWGYNQAGTVFYYDSVNSSKPIKDAYDDWLDINYNDLQSDKAIAGVASNQLEITGHKLSTGDRVVFNQTSVEITGLTDGSYYYVRFVDADNVKMYSTLADAQNDTDVITLGGSPAGTAKVKLSRAGELDLTGASADAAMIVDYLLAYIPSLLGRVQPIDDTIWDNLIKQRA